MKTRTTRKIVYIVFSLLLIIPYVAATYEEQVHEGIFLVRPENQYIPDRPTPTYLSSEDLTFFACIEQDDTPVRLSLLCEDNNNFIDIAATKWGTENCYIGSVDLDEFPCTQAVIAADYVNDGENQRITKDVKINEVTKSLERILGSQYSDGGWSSPLDTAYALFSLKPFENVFNETVSKGLLYLKNTRDEPDKCWPEDGCQLSMTTMILYLVSQAGYQDDLRIVHDGSVYLDKTMSYIDSGETWEVEIGDFLANYNNSVNTSCVFGYGSDETEYNISKYPEEYNVTVTPDYDVTINVVCTENIYADIYSSVRGHFLHYEGDNFTYQIPGPCWTLNNENVTCDVRSTVLALGTQVDEDRHDAAATYLASLLEDSVTGLQFPDDDAMNLALFLNTAGDALSSEERERVVRHLLYTQTNEGSWNVSGDFYNYSYYEPQQVEIVNLSHVINDNVTESIIYTGFVVQALLNESFERGDEVIEDAERWVSLNEDVVSTQLDDESALDEEIVASYEANVTDILNNTKRNGMALFVLRQFTRPILTSSPRIISLDKQNLTLELVNPTTFTLESLDYELPSDLSSQLSIDEKEYFAPYSFRKVLVSQETTDTEDAFGYLRITQGGDEYAKIPVLLERFPKLNMTFPQSLIVFGTSTVVPLPITKSGHDFACTLQWKDAGISSLSSFTIENLSQFNLPLQFSQPATEEKSYSGVLTCTAKTSTFTFPFTFQVSRFITKPLSIQPSALVANESEQILQFSLKNLLDESIDVTIGLSNSTAADYIDFSDYVLNLYPGEARNVSVFITTPTGENVSADTAILIRTFNVEERIPLVIDVISVPKQPKPAWLLVSASVFSVGLLALISYYGYTNRKKIYDWYLKHFRKESELERVMKKVEDYEAKGEAVAIKNMVQILKMEGVSDKDIRKRLTDEGFTETEITVALKLKTDEQPPVAQGTAPRK